MEEPEITDNERAALAARGDLNAFRFLVEKHQSAAVSIAYRISNDFHAAEDIAQDAFIRSYQKLHQYKSDKGTFSAWLFTIVRNTALNHRRKVLPISTDEDTASSSVDSPAETTSRREQWQLLDQTLDQLEEPFRSAFILAEIEELPLAEIAIIEGVPVGTIKSRISRARKKLREALSNPSNQLT